MLLPNVRPGSAPATGKNVVPYSLFIARLPERQPAHSPTRTEPARRVKVQPHTHDEEEELEHELEQARFKWDLIGLAEMRRKGEQMEKLKSGHVL